MFAVRSSCARCWRAGQHRTLATNPSPPPPRRRSSPSPTPTPEQLVQQHPAFRQPAPSLPKQRTPPAPPSARPPPPVRPRPALREPPLVERARQKTVAQRSVWESYLVLPWNVRLALWLGIAAFATVGLYAGDYFYPVEEDELERALEGEKARMGSSRAAA